MVEMGKLRLLLLAATTLLASCATETFTAENAPEYMILRDRTPFYRFGPAQPGPPDARLDRDNRVRLLRREFGYSLVQLGTKQTGYVANQDMTPAPPRRAYALATGRGADEDGGSSGRAYDGPIFDDVPLPDLDANPADGPTGSVEELPLIGDDIPTEISATARPDPSPTPTPDPTPDPTATPAGRP